MCIAPHYLSYFPCYVGGPERGHELLADSNVDWGQDLPALLLELEGRQYRKVLFAYFGRAAPSAYGIRAVKWNTATTAEAAECDWVALSANKLEGVYNNRQQFEAFRALRPTASAGYSIFLYRVTDPGVKEAIANSLTIPANER